MRELLKQANPTELASLPPNEFGQGNTIRDVGACPRSS